MMDTVEVVTSLAEHLIIETSAPEDVEWAGVEPGVVEITEPSQIAVVVEIPVPGFPGPPGSGSAAQIMQEERVDLSLNDYTIFRGEAILKSGDDEPVWRIRRVTIGYGGIVRATLDWANGDQGFVHRWSERYTYSYT